LQYIVKLPDGIVKIIIKPQHGWHVLNDRLCMQSLINLVDNADTAASKTGKKQFAFSSNLQRSDSHILGARASDDLVKYDFMTQPFSAAGKMAVM
jgi:hypothetical protein